MLDQLPAEIVRSILSYLPTVSAITNVSQTNKKLYEVVKNGQGAIYHDFVQRQFPTIESYPPWPAAAFKLTSRSRAWDRRAFIARECVPPRLEGDDGHRVFRDQAPGRQTFGFMPVIDSYESFGTAGDREVLAWGAAGRLRMRITRGKVVKWSSLHFPGDADPRTDILDLRLLRPYQHVHSDGESIFIRRANRELALLEEQSAQDEWSTRSRYLIPPDVAIECVDVSDDRDPFLAVCNSGSIHLFPVHSPKTEVRSDVIACFSEAHIKQRMRCTKFLSREKIAVAPQYLTGLQAAPIQIFDIEGAGKATVLLPVDELTSTSTTSPSIKGRYNANVLCKVSRSAGTSASDDGLLLSGWSDGRVRLYDTREGQRPVREFSDTVDDGQIFSLLPIGCERFLAGSHQNGCLKTFDMRMDGRVYDYTQVAPRTNVTSNKQSRHAGFMAPAWRAQRDINIFLALTVNHGNRPWRPISNRNDNSRLPRYNGSIYSLSSPSAMSSTVYVGIENHVLQLDAINADDWSSNRGGIRETLDDRQILNLSCYERPREGRESKDTVLLRKQEDLAKSRDRTGREPGWDERWYIEQPRTRKGVSVSWRSGRAG